MSNQRGQDEDLLALGALTAAAAAWIDSEDGFMALLARLGGILGYTSGRVWHETGAGALAAGAAWIAEPKPGEHLPDALGRSPLTPLENGLTSVAYKSSRPSASDDLPFVKRFVGEPRRLRSALVVPFCRGATITGVVSLFSEERVRPSEAVMKGIAVVALALGDRLSPREAGQLSPRELDVLRLASYGLTNTEIAGRLNVSVATVKTHLVHVFAKLAAPDRAAAVASALRDGLIV